MVCIDLFCGVSWGHIIDDISKFWREIEESERVRLSSYGLFSERASKAGGDGIVSYLLMWSEFSFVGATNNEI